MYLRRAHFQWKFIPHITYDTACPTLIIKTCNKVLYLFKGGYTTLFRYLSVIIMPLVSRKRLPEPCVLFTVFYFPSTVTTKTRSKFFFCSKPGIAVLCCLCLCLCRLFIVSKCRICHHGSEKVELSILKRANLFVVLLYVQT